MELGGYIALVFGCVGAMSGAVLLARSAMERQSLYRETSDGHLEILGPRGEHVTIDIGRIDHEDPRKIERAIRLVRAARNEIARGKHRGHCHA